jgi:small subunit ribosomal protein S4e
MGKKGGLNRLKRQLAPAFWEVPRKGYRFALKPIPATHPIARCYPLGILLRDIFNIAPTMREVEKVVKQGNVLIDGVKRYDVHFPVGLMDVIEIPLLKKAYRLVPKDGVELRPIEISDDEKGLKLCKIIRKQKVKGDRIQYTLHDGRNILQSNNNFNTHDTLLIKVPGQEVIDAVRLQNNTLALVTGGANVGMLGSILEVKEGNFTLPKRVTIKDLNNNKHVELPVNLVIAVGGSGKPLIRVS